MDSFYRYLLTYRNTKTMDEKRKLADWVFYDHDYPKHSSDYDEISNYLEWNSPFPNALAVFDELWEIYKLRSR